MELAVKAAEGVSEFCGYSPYQRAEEPADGKEMEPGEVEADASLGERIVAAGAKYLDRMLWTIDAERIVSDIPGEKQPVANDFKLLFWKSYGKLPERVQARVLEKYERTRDPNRINIAYTEDMEQLRRENELRMCCWEFCYLALMDAGVVTEDQMDTLCILVEVIERQAQQHFCIADAWYKGDLYEHKTIQQSGQSPSPGDLLIFSRQSRPIHAGISLGGEDMMDLSYSRGVAKGKYTEIKGYLIYSFPCGSIATNIKNFIHENRIFYTFYSAFPKCEEEMAELLAESQYRNLLPEIRGGGELGRGVELGQNLGDPIGSISLYSFECGGEKDLWGY